jgi:regulator of protease activity HflC (stomatin/prohibitin superfamily)
VAGVIALILIFSSLFTIQTSRMGIIERFGKFARTATPGLNFKLPIIESAKSLDMRVLQLASEVETKTKDNVFVKIPISIQYFIEPARVVDAFYKLSNPQEQMLSYAFNIILGHVPTMTLDDVFSGQAAIALEVMTELQRQMEPYGYGIAKVQFTDVRPAQGVIDAMNSINAAQRQQVAAQAKGEAEKIIKVKAAEADAEAKALSGKGFSNEQIAIAEGRKRAMELLRESAPGLTDEEATVILTFNNWTDMLRSVGTAQNSTVIFVPSGPGGLQDFQQQMSNAFLATRTPRPNTVSSSPKNQ